MHKVMKKLISISMFSIALLAVSCQKEVITMNEAKTAEAPVWRSASTAPGVNSGSTTGAGAGITDPNNDPDMNSKKVVKNN